MKESVMSLGFRWLLVLFSSCQPSFIVHQAVLIIKSVEISRENCEFSYFSFQFCQFLLSSIWSSLVRYTFRILTSSWQIGLLCSHPFLHLLGKLIFCHYVMFLFIPYNFLCFEVYLDISIGPWAFFWLVLVWWFFSWPFNLRKTLYSKQVF